MKTVHQLSIFIFFGLLFGSCFPETPQDFSHVNYDFADKDLQTVYRLSANGNTDSLKLFIEHKNPNIRYALAQNLADGQQKAMLEPLYTLLDDKNIEVSSAAAFAIGQYGDKDSAAKLMKAYDALDTFKIRQHHNAAILEAIGKVGAKTDLDNIANIKSFYPKDTTLLLGQLRALQNFSSRKMLDANAIEVLFARLSDEKMPEQIKVLAAHILGRISDLDVQKYEQRLYNEYQKSNDPLVKMALIKALKGTQNIDIQKGLLTNLGNEDSRVTINTLNAIGGFPYKLAIGKVIPLLIGKDQQVALSAVDYIKKHGLKGKQANIYGKYVKAPATTQTQVALLGAILHNLPRGMVKTRQGYSKLLKQYVNDTTDVYTVRQAIDALASDPDNYQFLLQNINNTNNPIVSSAATNSLHSILASDKLATFYRRPEVVKKAIVDSLKTKLAINDAGVSAIIGEIFSNKNLGVKPYLGDGAFLKDAMSKITRQEDMEAFESLSMAYANIMGQSYQKRAYDIQPINWAILEKVGHHVKAEFITEKGTFVAELYPQRAPQSVANFITLANEEYFNGKPIHRVVPNFVIQSGCSRGDGYSSMDYTIRSEVSQAYYEDEGYLGMASLGYNTESSQWFVTHSPTLHLNGRYTIFGKIISGMDVVNNCDIGDVIEEVKITKGL